MSQATPPPRDEAVAALDRLYKRKVISLEEGQAAARLLAGDDAVFPPPAPPPRAKPNGPAEPAAEAPAKPDEAPAQTDAPTETAGSTEPSN